MANAASTPTARALPCHRKPEAQQGVVLIVALIVLVALGLAALALLRSVDVASLVAGNLSFKRSAVAASDRGVAQALAQFQTLVDQSNSNAAQCYSATVLPVNAQGVPTALADRDTFDDTYPGCAIEAGEGETVSYVIDRQCTVTGFANERQCTLARRKAPGKDNWNNAKTIEYSMFRVTVRVDGPKNTVSFTQVLFKPPI